ncbi:MAG: hypothetical protein NXI24_15910 [bacterium]|nr:hypothetical protein [bacterium]
MALNEDKLKRLQALSRADFVRALQEANDVAPIDGRPVAAKEDRDTMRETWDALYLQEQQRLFPPYERPPFQFPEDAESDATVVPMRKKLEASSSNLRGGIFRAAAALLIFLAGALAFRAIDSGLFSGSDARIVRIEKEIVSPTALAQGRVLNAPARIEGDFGSVEVSRGFLHADWTADLQSLVSFNVAAEFNLRSDMNLHLRHPVGALRVTGTRFNVDFSPTGGSVEVSEGSVEWSPASNAGGASVVVKAPARVFFDAERVVYIDREVRVITAQSEKRGPASPQGFPDDASVQRFRLSSGGSVIGFVVRGTGSELIIQLRDGSQKRIRKADLVSSENLP